MAAEFSAWRRLRLLNGMICYMIYLGMVLSLNRCRPKMDFSRIVHWILCWYVEFLMVFGRLVFNFKLFDWQFLMKMGLGVRSMMAFNIGLRNLRD